MRQCDAESFSTGNDVIAFKNSLYGRNNDADVVSGQNYFGLCDDVVSGQNYFGLCDDVVSGQNYFGLCDDVVSIKYFSRTYSQYETLQIKNYLISLGYVNKLTNYSNDLPVFIDMEIPC
jgi:hypothetical protein